MRAKFDGLCIECDQPIKKDIDVITKRDSAWVHVDCPMPTESMEFCDRCFTYKSLDGSCLC